MSLLAGLYGWLPTKCIDAQGRPLGLMSGVAIREKFFGLNRRWSPEPTDAEVSRRVTGILKAIGVRCRRKRRARKSRPVTLADMQKMARTFFDAIEKENAKPANRVHPFLALAEKAVKKQGPRAPLVVRCAP